MATQFSEQHKNEFDYLITAKEVSNCRGQAIFEDEHKNPGHVILVTVADYWNGAKASVSVAKVWGTKEKHLDNRRAEIIGIPCYMENDNFHALVEIILECISQYPDALILFNTSGAGVMLAKYLSLKSIRFKEVNWGGLCFLKSNREKFGNMRDHAFVGLHQALMQGRFKIKENNNYTDARRQLSKIPYRMDSSGRIRILTKEQMIKAHLEVLDLANAFAFIFVEGVDKAIADHHSWEEAVGNSEKCPFCPAV